MSETNDNPGTRVLVVGLGNPGARYSNTRHNAGFMVLDRLAQDRKIVLEKYGRLGWVGREQSEDRSLFLLKPATYMNRSGVAVGDLVDQEEIPFSRTLEISDDFALNLGRIRIRRRGSDGGHNGLESIIRTLGTDLFPRLRIGIGPLPDSIDPVDFVLQPFDGEEQSMLPEVLNRASEAIRLWLKTTDLDLCMSRFN
ncbi:MAG: aminoacyl-tRNA hydrolase [Planctomycetes bacterium]|nr:aminoacyl-tRNA hydrolase [Planctomycetota bacterium]